MSGEPALLNTAIGRTAAVLLTAALAFVLAPVAAATPESDAVDAINQTYDASGGTTGPMGPSDGGVYPIGGGFGQNFAGGKIFFTPDTGAHIMGGAILEKYESLGGAADGDLGFPTIDEGPGLVSPDSRNTTFSAADKPVIFWTPDTGAHVVRGAINAAWDKLGGSAGPLGVPTEDEAFKGDVVTQKFTGGELSWNRASKEFTTVPPDLAGQLDGLAIPDDATSAINAARRAAGGALGPLGAKQGEQYAIGQDGAGQDFAGGKVFYSPATGANVVSGQILEKYESVGGPESDLGFPASTEADGGLKTDSRVSTFSAKDQPVIFWTPDYGAFIVRGAMNAAWGKLGGAAGSLGPPMADQTESGNVVTQRFTGGEISWDKQTNKFSTQPANLASGLSGLSVPGYEPAKAPNAAASDSNERNWFTPSWWWLLALVPLLVLVGLVAAATLRNRGGEDVDALENPFDVDTTHDTAAEAEALRLEDSDDHPSVRLADHYDRPSGSAPFGLGGLHRKSLEPADGEGDEFSEFEPDPDNVDTAPTRILSEADPTSGRHAAVQLDEPRADLHEPDESRADLDEPDEPPADLDEPDEPPPDLDEPDEPAADLDEPAEPPADLHEPAEPAADLDEPAEPPADLHEPAEAPVDVATPSDAPAPPTAIHLPLADPYLAPTGYPVKADTESGRYWVPESDLYEHVPADVYFVNEEVARANGFVNAD